MWESFWDVWNNREWNRYLCWTMLKLTKSRKLVNFYWSWEFQHRFAILFYLNNYLNCKTKFPGIMRRVNLSLSWKFKFSALSGCLVNRDIAKRNKILLFNFKVFFSKTNFQFSCFFADAIRLVWLKRAEYFKLLSKRIRSFRIWVSLKNEWLWVSVTLCPS